MEVNCEEFLKPLRPGSKIAVIGSKHISKETVLVIENFLNRVVTSVKDVKFISGGARGVDTVVRDSCRRNNLTFLEFLPNWKLYGRTARPIKNSQVVEEADYTIALIASPESSGTEDTIKKTRKRNKPFHLINLQNKFTKVFPI